MSTNVIRSSSLKKDISTFLSDYQEKLAELFNERNDENQLVNNRGLPPYVLRQILDCKPLSTFIPKENGGRGAITSEALAMLDTTSYRSLPLSLMMGINGALFLQPLANYGHESAQDTVFKRFIEDNNMGGLMITEPDFGSDALRMQTGFSQNEETGEYRIKGTKHWGGLTGWADFWLITAREIDKNGNLSRDIGFFVHDSLNGGIEVEEYYKNIGLLMLPYGLNKLDITVPQDYRLEPKSTGVKMMLDILHRSRLQFAGMSTGFLRRILDEALEHCKDRFVGGKSLFTYDQVKERLANLQSYFTVSSSMCYFSSKNVSMDIDTSKMDVAANSIKSVVSDYMHEASQSLMQLAGAKGFRLDSFAGRAFVDSRPFQIFEGSNDILYQQISESILKKMKKSKVNNLYQFLKDYSLTYHSAEYFKDQLNFEVDHKMAQRKMVQLGRALGRIVTMNMTITMGESGFNSDLIANSLKSLTSEVNMLVAKYTAISDAEIIDDYQSESSWSQLIRA